MMYISVRECIAALLRFKGAYSLNFELNSIQWQIYNNPGDYCEVTDVYFDWTSGADGKYNTARIMASAANDFYNK